jgi:ferrochelatase
MTQRRIALVLFNLGGPDSQEAVRPFLFNLFNDKWIIAAPAPIRMGIAGLISTTRAKSARANYAKMAKHANYNGGSPIVPETQAQADALERALSGRLEGAEVKCFLGMRYWKPYAADAASAAKAWGATEAILLPLYPQFSSTTTRSAIEAWEKASDLPTRTLCCYPAGAQFARAHAEAILAAWEKGGRPEKPRVLFSAHGLPQRTIDKGDGYQWQVEQTVAAVRPLLPAEWDHRICYQSRVGPLKWIGPSTEEEIDRAAHDKAGVIVSPIAFVSEHIETLVELDEEYAEVAHEKGVPFYLRAPALGAAPAFIEALADLTLKVGGRTQRVASETGERLCPGQFGLCPMQTP